MSAPVSGVVLAGGESRRMGRDKAMLPLEGRTLLERQVERLKRAGIEDIMISGGHGGLSGARPIADAFPGRGPLGGLHACLAGAKHAHCLVVSVDVPLVPDQALAALIDAHLSSAADATLLAHGGKREPLIAVYRSSLAKRAEARLLGRDYSMRGFLAGLDCAEYRYTGDEALLLNCNTMDDYRAACGMTCE